MNILLIESFFTDSHKQWAEGFQKHSKHEIRILSLAGRHWKWRMHGAAVSLARRFMEMDWQPDQIWLTDMIDVGVFLALSRTKSAGIPVVLYMHENQLTYPWSPTDADVSKERDRHYAFINYSSCLAADRILFNSRFHLHSFLNALPAYLQAFPDHQELDLCESIHRKAQVLPLGLDHPGPARPVSRNEIPILLWNHRWEYDKGPEEFFETLFALAQKGYAFKLIVLGKSYGKKPPIFQKAKQQLAERIIHWGFEESRGEYFEWLDRADLLPVCSRHDFFGLSVVEAIAHETIPLLPRRLAYPEHVPDGFLYDNGCFAQKLEEFLINWNDFRHFTVRKWIESYFWENLIAEYDAFIETAFNQ